MIVKLQGIDVDKPNRNGRVYSKDVVQDMVDQMNAMAKDRKLLITQGASPDLKVSMLDIIGVGTDVNFDGEEILVTCDEIEGKHLQDWVDNDIVEFTPCCEGQVNRIDGHDVVTEVNFKHLSANPLPPERAEEELPENKDETPEKIS